MGEQLKIPEKVEVCGWCKGEGRYEQTYNAGCGGGLYQSMGRCDICKGFRFIMKDTFNSIPSESILNQIREANPTKDLSKVWA